MQKQIENNGVENDKPVDALYIGNEDITMALEKLKVELTQARLHTKQTINDSKETIKANQIESSGTTDEIIVLEIQEKEPSMDY